MPARASLWLTVAFTGGAFTGGAFTGGAFTVAVALAPPSAAACRQDAFTVA